MNFLLDVFRKEKKNSLGKFSLRVLAYDTDNTILFQMYEMEQDSDNHVLVNTCHSTKKKWYLIDSYFCYACLF